MLPLEKKIGQVIIKQKHLHFFIVKNQAFHTLDKKLIFARNKTIIIKFKGKNCI